MRGSANQELARLRAPTTSALQIMHASVRVDVLSSSQKREPPPDGGGSDVACTEAQAGLMSLRGSEHGAHERYGRRYDH